MKRLTALIALLALLLCACGAPKMSAPADSSPEQAGLPAAPEIPETPDRPEQPDAPAEPEISGSDPEPALEPLPPESGTTAGGVTVHTDYSHYTPYEAPQSVGGRLTEEWIPDLMPSDNYGMLYPFAGSLLYSNYYYGYGYAGLAGAMYGLFDESGRVVADPTYTEIEQLVCYDYSSFTTTWTRLPMLRLARSGEVTRVEYDDWSYLDGGNVYALATLDGSFVTDCVYGFVKGLKCGVLAMESYNEPSFTLYGLDGSVLLTERDLSFAERVREYGYGSMLYGDGLLTIGLDDGFYYMDLTGSLKLGPYQSAEPFSDGRAVVSLEEGRYGVIDTEGNFVLEPNYSLINVTSGGAPLRGRRSTAAASSSTATAMSCSIKNRSSTCGKPATASPGTAATAAHITLTRPAASCSMTRPASGTRSSVRQCWSEIPTTGWSCATC